MADEELTRDEDNLKLVDDASKLDEKVQNLMMRIAS
jgi:hypothetical protein